MKRFVLLSLLATLLLPATVEGQEVEMYVLPAPLQSWVRFFDREGLSPNWNDNVVFCGQYEVLFNKPVLTASYSVGEGVISNAFIRAGVPYMINKENVVSRHFADAIMQAQMLAPGTIPPVALWSLDERGINGKIVFIISTPCFGEALTAGEVRLVYESLSLAYKIWIKAYIKTYKEIAGN